MNAKIYVFILVCLLVMNRSISQLRHPGVRNAHCMVYDADKKTMVVFGGADEKEVKNDTWLYRNSQWKQYDGPSPPKRTFASMVYDPFRKQIVLFGGNKVLFGDSSSGNTAMSDTWVFNHNKWKQEHTAHSPPARIEACMAFNEKNNTLLLFGGYSFSDGLKREIKRLNDTWEFNGADWKLISTTGPAPRSGCTMAFDNNLRTCILFGGNIRATLNDPMWKWEGSSWKQLTTKSATVYNTSMVFEKNKKLLVRYGGYDGKTRVDTSWYYATGNDWQVLKTSERPSPRNHAAMVYDDDKKVILLYGGHDGNFVFGDVWKLKDERWIQISETLPRRRIGNNH